MVTRGAHSVVCWISFLGLAACSSGSNNDTSGPGDASPTDASDAASSADGVGTGDGASDSSSSDSSSSDGTVADGASFDGGAGDAAPRQIAPLSTSRVTSRRPTLHWLLPSGVPGATVDFCLDRACTKPVGTPATVTGSSYAPASDLPTGVVYWRLHPSTAAAVTSPTWQLAVGARSATDASWGTTLDVNGDGYADVVATAWGASSGTGHAYIFVGGLAGLATTPSPALFGPDGAGGHFGRSAASAGDVNGDGFADLLVGADRAAGNAGRAYVYLGGATGLASAPATTLTGPDSDAGTESFGFSAASAGDVNGDGYADVVVGAFGALGGAGAAYVYLGSATGLSTAAAFTLTGSSDRNFGISVASAGDINGDGFADIVVGASGLPSSAGSVSVYLGSASGISTTPTTVLTGPGGTGGRFGGSVAGAGDVNGDGFADLVVGGTGASGTGSAYIYLGGASGLSTTQASTLTDPAGASTYFGASVASAGDVDGNGYSDVVVGAFNGPGGNGIGHAYVYSGSPAGLAMVPATTLTGPVVGGQFGVSVAGAGDITGDGYSDLVVGAQSESSSTGSAYVYLGGSATGIVVTPATTLAGTDGNLSEFGGCVFGSTN